MGVPTYRVLLFEDNPGDAALLRAALGICVEARFEIAWVTRLADGLKLLSETCFDILLVDLSLPDTRGLPTLAAIQDAAGGTPVVVLTGLDDTSLALRAVRQGAQDYLVKGHADDYQIAHALLYAIERQRLPQDRFSSEGTQILTTVLPEIPGYRLLRPLGGGNASVVYLASREGDPSSRLAIKVMRLSPCLTPAESRQYHDRFINEAHIAARIKHGHVVEVFDFGMAAGDLPYIVMEYIDGEPLHRALGSLRELRYPENARLLRQLAEALRCIHEWGICHRDVKPSNVMLTRDRNAKLMDFGVAKLPNDELDRNVHLIGSPAYMAPESYLGVDVDARADLFSLGVLGYEILTGRRPFTGDSLDSLGEQIRTRRPTEPRKLDPEFPADLQAILARLLKKNPPDRYQGAAELVEDLNRYLDHRPLAAPPLLDSFAAHFRRTDWS